MLRRSENIKEQKERRGHSHTYWMLYKMYLYVRVVGFAFTEDMLARLVPISIRRSHARFLDDVDKVIASDAGDLDKTVNDGSRYEQLSNYSEIITQNRRRF